jgi:hypothetical protein
VFPCVEAQNEVARRTVWLYEPVAEDGAREDALAPRPTSFEGKVVALLDNTKPLADVLLAEAKSLLERDYPGAVFRSFRKPSVSGADRELVEQLAGCDAVVTALGD